MTAEVGVMNNLGVALAADSAVTIGGLKKIYTSAEKLFQLAAIAPVGIMFYGNANFVGLPWETIIKAYRRNLGKKTFATINGYAENLVRFLTSNQGLFPQSAQIEENTFIVAECYYRLLQQTEARLETKRRDQGSLNDKDIKVEFEKAVKAELRALRKKPLLKGLPKNCRQKLRAKYRKNLADLKRNVFGKLPMTSSAKGSLTTIAIEVLLRTCFGRGRSGLVVAGFGESEHKPAVVHVVVEGMVENRPRFVVDDRTSINLDNTASVLCFAQREMVETFMDGINGDLRSYMEDSVGVLFRGVTNAIMDRIDQSDKKLGKQLRADITPKFDMILQRLFDAWKTKSKNNYSGPIIDVVASLPKAELASMAEALVNLTRFKRRVTPEEETVGGPIDVAVITKGDGFVWVKRKHYFEAELNPRIMTRYLKEGN